MKAHRNSRRRRALRKRTPWLCLDGPLVGLPPTWGLLIEDRSHHRKGGRD